jgi:undecaprenyl-diphosphatase
VQWLRDAIARKPGALRFIGGVALASLPAALAGVLLHDFIKTVIYETPVVICVMLILGGSCCSMSTSSS